MEQEGSGDHHLMTRVELMRRVYSDDTLKCTVNV